MGLTLSDIFSARVSSLSAMLCTVPNFSVLFIVILARTDQKPPSNNYVFFLGCVCARPDEVHTRERSFSIFLFSTDMSGAPRSSKYFESTFNALGVALREVAFSRL